MKKLLMSLTIITFFLTSPGLFAADCKKADLIGTWNNTMLPSTMNIRSITFTENGEVECEGCGITKWEYKSAAYPWIQVSKSDGSSSKWTCEPNVRNFINLNGEIFEKVKSKELQEPFTLPPVSDYANTVTSPKSCEAESDENSACQSGEE